MSVKVEVDPGQRVACGIRINFDLLERIGDGFWRGSREVTRWDRHTYTTNYENDNKNNFENGSNNVDNYRDNCGSFRGNRSGIRKVLMNQDINRQLFSNSSRGNRGGRRARIFH